MKRAFLFLILIYSGALLSAQPKQEIRAVWLTTNYGLDWPRKPIRSITDIEEQKEELDRILDNLQRSHINVVFLQTRLRGDVIYRSDIEPYSEYVQTGWQFRDIYDPLAYAVEACHKRGIECHAWFVTYPLGQEKVGSKSKQTRAVVRNKESVRTHKGELYLDPGDPKTTSYLLSLIKEIVSSYDIDGIHLDYIRYPDRATSFPDQFTYKLYGKGKDKNAWRRENINRFVYAAYDTVKALKPWVQVSSSVVGMYSKIPGNTQRHWTAYHDVYQDPADWMEKGKQDFIVPMMYYKENLFFPFVQDWQSRCNDRFVVPGLGLYQMDKNESDWESDIIIEQLRYSRTKQVNGNAFYRAKHLLNNKKGVLDGIRNEFYTTPAVLPPLTWLSDSIPDKPSAIYAESNKNTLKLSWENAFQNDGSLFYNLYRSKDFPVDLDDPENLIAVRLKDEYFEIPIDNSVESGFYYVVTSYDRYHNESEASWPAFFVTGNFEK